MNSETPRLSVLVATITERRQQPSSIGKADESTFIGTLFELFVLAGLLHKLQNLRSMQTC